MMRKSRIASALIVRKFDGEALGAYSGKDVPASAEERMAAECWMDISGDPRYTMPGSRRL